MINYQLAGSDRRIVPLRAMSPQDEGKENVVAADGKDKRVQERVDVKVEVTFNTGKQLITSYMKNVSRGGLFIRTDKPLPLDTEVELNFRLPDSYRLFKARGLVVWNSPKGGRKHPGMGVQFREMSEEDKEHLDKVIAALLEKESE